MVSTGSYALWGEPKPYMGVGMMNPLGTRESGDVHGKAIGLLVMAGLMWSFTSLQIKLVEWNAISIAGVRSAVAAIALLGIVRRPQFTWSPAQVGGAIAYALGCILIILANRLTTAANAILLTNTAPIYAALLGAWFLGERTTWFDWLTIVLVMVGVMFMFSDELTDLGFWGVVCGVGSGLSHACTSLFLRKQKDGSALESILLGIILVAVLSAPFVFQSLPMPRQWWLLVTAGVFSLAIPYVLYSTAMKYVTALEATLLSSIDSVFSPLWVFLIIGETLGRGTLIGGAIILIAITAYNVIMNMEPLATSNDRLAQSEIPKRIG